jgi:hypothetical protein
MVSKALDVAAVLSAGSMLWWGFTGIPLWAPVAFEDAGRAFILIAAHVMPVMFCFIKSVGA